MPEAKELVNYQISIKMKFAIFAFLALMCVAFYIGAVDAECVVDPDTGDIISGKNRDKCDSGSDCCSTVCDIPKLLGTSKIIN